ncbi:glycosyltransferase family 4 protein [Sphingobium sp. YR768]|uniref:glycosyltransferase family 4 protein n=1 Tax=Sphingobium sp. YR768 TaxID=1884365 RepID=UPI0008C5DAA1|nr:glycosyltransferase family 4 protein [Sphingobium sp. YR768]SES17478.1 Glycosyltransferase involved in cell wall bisynthesis [Sphingobium sp. YR768]
MRIGIIAHLKHPIAEPFAGGLEMHTHLLARSLRDRGHAVTLFASSKSEPEIGLEAICAETAIQAVGTTEATDVPFFREHHAYLSLMNDLRHRNFDIIHNNSLHYLPVAMADSLPMPMVTTLHTPPFCWLESGIRLCTGRNHNFVAVSRSVAGLWKHVTQSDTVIWNGIDLQKFAFHPQPDADPYLVWYGRIVPEKGLHLAIEAARQVGLPLKIAGPILDEDYYRTNIAPALGEDAIHVGHLAHQELARLVGGAQAFLCTPMWDEPYGLVVAEALASGVPVAAFARGAIPEILDATCGVLATPDDVASLAHAVLSALTLDRRACRTRAEDMCDADHMVDHYEALYQRQIDQATPPARADRTASIHLVPSTLPTHTPLVARSASHG